MSWERFKLNGFWGLIAICTALLIIGFYCEVKQTQGCEKAGGVWVSKLCKCMSASYFIPLK